MIFRNPNQILREITLVTVAIALFGIGVTLGFTVAPSTLTKSSMIKQATHQSGILFQNESPRVTHLSAIVDSSSLVVAESWRQYVPLIVSLGIIVDILLGNPLANAVLKPMRPEEEGDENDKEERPRSKSRIDAELIAQQALDKANNTLELRKYLEDSKTDYDRMEEMKKKLDASMQDLDEDLAARQSKLDERKG